MAVKDTTKFLQSMNSFVAKEYKRGAIDKFPTVITFTAKASGEGFKAGYADVLKKSPDLPILTDEDFLEVGTAVVASVAAWSNKENTRGTTLKHHADNSLVQYRAGRDIKSVYKTAKKAGSDKINEILQRSGSRKLQGASKEKNISARGSEIGVVKSGLHRAHQGVTTVGAAQMSAAFRFLGQTKGFGGFASSEEAKEIWDIFKNINATFSTTGTKSGSKPQVVSLKEDLFVNIDMLPRGQNRPGTEDYDLTKLYPKVEKAILSYINNQPIESMAGSKSIKENAEDVVTYMLLTELTNFPGARVVGPVLKPAGRKKKKVSKQSKGKSKVSSKGSRKRAGPLTRTNRTKTAAMQPLHLIGLINKELPDRVRKNMQLPGLQNQTGRFAESVRLTDINQTSQGFPSIGYTYQKSPYQVFEDGAGSSPWANGQRDPRKLIDRSIREIAAQFALGRFYTRRV
jgi:hypothetical protein